jgi:hypothetical protein
MLEWLVCFFLTNRRLIRPATSAYARVAVLAVRTSELICCIGLEHNYAGQTQLCYTILWGWALQGENKERWRKLCEQAPIEQDLKKLDQIINQINELLLNKRLRLEEAEAKKSKE